MTTTKKATKKRTTNDLAPKPAHCAGLGCACSPAARSCDCDACHQAIAAQRQSLSWLLQYARREVYRTAEDAQAVCLETVNAMLADGRSAAGRRGGVR